jgi:antitoxin component YwqK of YwqJK toxin-antitoxin module
MKRILCFSLLLLAGNAFCQKEAPINSVDIYNKAVELAGNKNYDDAYKEIIKIDRNDSLYVPALLEKAGILLAQQKYDEVITSCKEGIALNESLVHDFYLDMGSAYDNAKKTDEALATYDTGFKLFPQSYLMVFNKGVVYERLEKFPEALVCFKKAIKMNPLHPGSHLHMGIIASEEGKVSQAVMSFDMFLVLEPNSSRAFAVLKRLNEIVSSKYDHKSKGIKLSPEGGDDFSDLDLIITNYAALNSKFKTPAKVDLAIVKQNYALFTKLNYDKSDKGFWMQTYVKFFKDIVDQKRFKAFTWFMLQPSQNDKHKALVKKHASEIVAFNTWAFETITAAQPPVTVSANNKTYTLKPYFDPESRHMVCFGNKNDKGKFIGYYQYFFNNGKISSEGTFDDKGQRAGAFKTYYKNAGLYEDMNYVNDSLDGKYLTYFLDGKLKNERSFKHNQAQENEKEYNQSGLLSKAFSLKSDMKGGSFIFNYDLGDPYKQYVGTFVDGKITDTIYEYFASGSLAAKKPMKNQLIDGVYRSYYRSGKLSSVVNYSKGMKEGNSKNYFENGKLQSEGNYKADVQVGLIKTYYSDGTVSEEYEADEKGKRNGVIKDYDTDGKLYSELEYSKGEIVAYKYLAKDGSVLKADKKRSGRFDFMSYHPSGAVNAEGIYTKDGKEGLWKYHDEFGNLSSEENYNKDNQVEGKVTHYYEDGHIKDDANWKAGKREGYACTYHENGQIESEGWYVNGDEQGYWNYYRVNGQLSARKYFMKGDLSGYQQFFDVKGKLGREDLYNDKLISKWIYYDSLGIANETIEFDKGNKVYQLHYNNKQTSVSGTYIGGRAHGDFNWYNYSGKLTTKGSYFNDQKNGHWIYYDENGKIDSEGDYYYGKLDGKWTSSLRGKVTSVTNYYRGEQEGESVWYYETGAVSMRKMFHQNEEEGESTCYDPTGELQIRRFYKAGRLLWYTYNDKTGKLLPPIEVKNDTYKLAAYYKNGAKSREMNVVRGDVQGKLMVYAMNGKVIDERNYKDDEQDGIQLIYWGNGNLRTEETHLNGLLHGISKRYYPDGKVERTLTYVLDELNGEARYYNEAGKLIRTRVYYNNEVMQEKNF